MADELLRICHKITWLRTIIRQRRYGIETEFHFTTADGFLSVAIDTLAHFDFLCNVIHIDCLAIRERSLPERGWTENDRYEIRINDNDDIALETLHASYVRWGPTPFEEEQDTSS